MNSKFTLPIALSLALHAFLLFGFKSSPPAPAMVRTRIVEYKFPDLPADPEPVLQPDAHESSVKPKPDDQVVHDPAPAHDLPPVTASVDAMVFTRFAPVFTLTPGMLPSVGPGRDGDGPIGFTHLDNVPRAKSQIEPVYPMEARSSGLSGTVLVEFIVDERGHVHEPRVVRSSNSVFEDSALRGIAKWKFEPGLKNGHTVRYRMQQLIAFNAGG